VPCRLRPNRYVPVQAARRPEASAQRFGRRHDFNVRTIDCPPPRAPAGLEIDFDGRGPQRRCRAIFGQEQDVAGAQRRHSKNMCVSGSMAPGSRRKPNLMVPDVLHGVAASRATPKPRRSLSKPPPKNCADRRPRDYEPFLSEKPAMASAVQRPPHPWVQMSLTDWRRQIWPLGVGVVDNRVKKSTVGLTRSPGPLRTWYPPHRPRSGSRSRTRSWFARVWRSAPERARRASLLAQSGRHGNHLRQTLGHICPFSVFGGLFITKARRTRRVLLFSVCLPLPFVFRGFRRSAARLGAVS